MLREFDNVKQHEGEAPRRWFVDAYFDLIIWYEPDEPDRVLGFQLCYAKPYAEHALTWRRVGGFTHHAIDDGQSGPMANMSPILMPDGDVDVDDLRRRFTEACGDMDPIIARLVLQRLDEFAG